MQTIPLFGTGIRSISDIVTRQQRVNCIYDLRKDQDRSAVVVLSTPGARIWSTLTATPIRGWHVVSSTLYVCAGENLFAVLSDGSYTQVATGIQGSGPVAMADNSLQIIFATGNLGYVYTLSTSTLTQITDVFYPTGATSVVFINGRFIVNKPNTREFYVSALLDGLVWTYLGTAAIFGTKENTSDLLVSVGNLNGTLILWGAQSTEFWQTIDDLSLPFSRINGATQGWGLVAPLSAVELGNTQYFLASAPDGGISVVRLNGYAVEPISDSDMSTIFGSLGVVSDAVAFAYSVYGHPIYQITFPSEDVSYAYDTQTGVWHIAQTGPAEQARHFAKSGITFSSKNLVSRDGSGTIYVLDKDELTDFGTSIKRQIVTRHVRNQGNEISVGELFLDFETGVGTGPTLQAAGQIEFTTPETYAWQPPVGVTNVYALCIGGGGGGDGTTASGGDSSFGSFVTAGGGAGSDGVGNGGAGGTGTALSGTIFGGNGGAGAARASTTDRGGGGGAAGYSGNGGAGGSTSVPYSVGSGGGAAGGEPPAGSLSGPDDGGGVGIYGEGASGTLVSQGGSGGNSGNTLGSGAAALFGGGSGGRVYAGKSSTSRGGGGGGGLRWGNFSVTPGVVYPVVVGAGGGSSYRGGGGAVRIFWGPGRSLPSTNANDVPTVAYALGEQNPQVSLRISRDGGRTFGNERKVPLGKVGEYYSRVMLRRLGSARDFVVKITLTDSVRFVLASGSVVLETADD